MVLAVSIGGADIVEDVGALRRRRGLPSGARVLYAVGQGYLRFTRTSDDEVVRCSIAPRWCCGGRRRRCSRPAAARYEVGEGRTGDGGRAPQDPRAPVEVVVFFVDGAGAVGTGL